MTEILNIIFLTTLIPIALFTLLTYTLGQLTLKRLLNPTTIVAAIWGLAMVAVVIAGLIGGYRIGKIIFADEFSSTSLSLATGEKVNHGRLLSMGAGVVNAVVSLVMVDRIYGAMGRRFPGLVMFTKI